MKSTHKQIWLLYQINWAVEVSVKPLHWFSSFYTCFSVVLEDHITHKFYLTWSLMHHILRILCYSICITFFPWQYIHVLVCPKREVKRFVDLSSDETSDLWVTAKEVGARLEQYHKASSLTFAIQVWSMLQYYCFIQLILYVLNSTSLCNVKGLSYLDV